MVLYNRYGDIYMPFLHMSFLSCFVIILVSFLSCLGIIQGNTVITGKEIYNKILFKPLRYLYA